MVLRKLIHQNESSKIRFNFFSLVKSTNFEKLERTLGRLFFNW